LHEDIQCAFKTHRGYDYTEETEFGHGRIETRRCSILPAKDFLMEENLLSWRDLSTLVKIESSREVKGVRTEDTRYYISDEQITSASYYNTLARGHWGIENQLHWHLDVTFNEDNCRTRICNAPENLSTIRKFALQLISDATDKLSFKKRLYKAALDFGYMKKILRI